MVDRPPIPPALRRRLTETGCALCGGEGPYEIDHRIPLALGGSNDAENLQALCRECHLLKTAGDRKDIAKAERLRKRRLGIPSGRLVRKLDGTVERR